MQELQQHQQLNTIIHYNWPKATLPPNQNVTGNKKPIFNKTTFSASQGFLSPRISWEFNVARDPAKMMWCSSVASRDSQGMKWLWLRLVQTPFWNKCHCRGVLVKRDNLQITFLYRCGVRRRRHDTKNTATKNYKDLKPTMHKWNRNLRQLFAKICCKVQKVSSATLLNTMVLQVSCFWKVFNWSTFFPGFLLASEECQVSAVLQRLSGPSIHTFRFCSNAHTKAFTCSRQISSVKRWDTHLERWECVSVHLLWGICTCFRKTCRCHLTILQPGQTKKLLWRTRMSICIS